MKRLCLVVPALAVVSMLVGAAKEVLSAVLPGHL